MKNGRPGCEDRSAHRGRWFVVQRRYNRSAFNGGRRTPSRHSLVRCPVCGGAWRTAAAYVDQLPDA